MRASTRWRSSVRDASESPTRALNLDTAGRTSDEMLSALNGDMNFELVDGVIRGFNITHALLGDWFALVNYGTLFFYGFLLISCGKAFWDHVVRHRRRNLLLGLLSFTTLVVLWQFEDGVDYSGNRLSRSPEHNAVVLAGYDFAVGKKALLTVEANYHYVSKIFDDNSNNDLETRKPRNEVDARIILTTSNFEISLWGKNLTDERFELHQATFVGAVFAIYSAPRTYGVSFGWRP